MTRPRFHLCSACVVTLLVVPSVCMALAKVNGGSVWAAGCCGVALAATAVIAVAGKCR